MTTAQIRQLDRMWQIKVCSNPCIFGGIAEVGHHWIRRSVMATRWWLPNGISLTDKQHQDIHGKDGQFFKDRILELKGQIWLQELNRRAQFITQHIKYQNVIDYLNNKREDYI